MNYCFEWRPVSGWGVLDLEYENAQSGEGAEVDELEFIRALQME